MTVSNSLIIFLILCAVLQFAWIKRLRSPWGLRTFADVPNARSSHAAPVPRGGGIVFPIAIAVGLILSSAIEPIVPKGTFATVSGFILLAAVSFLDDVYSLDAKTRLFFHLFSSALVVSPLFYISFFTGPAIGLLFFLILYGATAINFFNFADGINGYVGLMGLFLSFTMITSVAPNLFAGVGLMGAVAVFLYFNLVRGQVFMGDVGSTSLGLCALLIAKTLLFYQGQSPEGLNFEVFAKIILLNMSIWWVVWVDCGSMVVAKIMNRFPVSKAHREHIYQRLSRKFGSHRLSSSVLMTSQLSGYVLFEFLVNSKNYFILFCIFFGLILFATANNFRALKTAA